jgi:outer membrane lipoprotein SlyB
VGSEARPSALNEGDRVEVRPRADEGHTWVVIASGGEHQFDHTSADVVLIKCQ